MARVLARFKPNRDGVESDERRFEILRFIRLALRTAYLRSGVVSDLEAYLVRPIYISPIFYFLIPPYLSLSESFFFIFWF
jgi:hypothetical protein